MTNQEIDNLIAKLNSLKQNLISLNENLNQNIDDLTKINTSNYIDLKINNINIIISNLQRLKLLI